MLGITWALGLLQAVPKVVAAAPDFKKLWDQLVDTFDGEASQQELKDAYAAAISDAADAHEDLQEIVARHS
jgi:ABC-type transporter Mla subunit MlaD